ncbi:amino-acid N-acetyltransferase [Pseudomonas sp. Tn43]|uniref:arsenic resistance N-acetyltransferase ArsN2 n=1 Tax=Pseudomonas sp. Tn43 TaxID=701213 RepID=UPI00181153B9|nr:arsenic resistance N-acetyltransferase ArsN2 [Pseudomonas sp. Tn43]MBB3238835.1 amino-acid N-acetyltransferase [Pseudomonas sp. Tn43]
MSAKNILMEQTMQMMKVGPSGLHQLRESLSEAGLPCDDVGEPGLQFFRFEVDGSRVAYGGLEGSGADLLLRSLIVCETRRGEGLGKAVLSELEHCAIAQGAVRLHLLTQSAAGFFAANGYELLDRGEAPVVISQTAQFKHLCPASARYLRKTL